MHIAPYAFPPSPLPLLPHYSFRSLLPHYSPPCIFLSSLNSSLLTPHSSLPPLLPPLTPHLRPPLTPHLRPPLTPRPSPLALHLSPSARISCNSHYPLTPPIPFSPLISPSLSPPLPFPLSPSLPLPSLFTLHSSFFLLLSHSSSFSHRNISSPGSSSAADVAAAVAAPLAAVAALKMSKPQPRCGRAATTIHRRRGGEWRLTATF
jgi:hypothetical protein